MKPPSDRGAADALRVQRPGRCFEGQKIAVVGLGKAGLPAALRLAEWGAEITAWDDKPESRAQAEAAGLRVADPVRGFRVAGTAQGSGVAGTAQGSGAAGTAQEISVFGTTPGTGIFGTAQNSDIAGTMLESRFDALLLSPGITLAHPAAQAATATGTPILVDAEYLFRASRAAGSQARFVGITGTNGKSTTTALLGHIMVRAGVPVTIGGNLGTAALSMPLLGDDGVHILEMSSYMLDRIDQLRFNVAVMLNLSPDHLDRHGDMAGYRAAKARIFARQQPEDLAVLGDDDTPTASLAEGLAARTIRISGDHDCRFPGDRADRFPGDRADPGAIWAEDGLLQDEAGIILDMAQAPVLRGSHNAQNAAAACAMAQALGVPRGFLAEALKTYPGLPHRAELVGTIRGVCFINDSKATNADSTARALASHARVIWIAGGIGKQGGIESLAPWFPRVAHAFLIGRDGPEFAASLARAGVPHTLLDTLEQALPAAAQAGFAGAADVVLLSPAAASWDQFTGFDARGDCFRALVAAMGEG